jgi:alpha-mannosidase/mannosylglycerate hydrolase
MTEKMARRRVHYVLSSHWDREWYQPFQVFRRRLVDLLDRVLGALEDGSLHGPFFCDGQSIVIEDYLEIRPNKRPLIVELVKSGKLIVGPWYDAPDEFAVSGEALVRNLRLGREDVRALGVEPPGVGFSADTFGRISQMPQLFKGFDMPIAFLWRGNNFFAKRHVIWEGADGTEIPGLRFGTNGYWGYFVNVRGLNDRPFKQDVFDHDLLRFTRDEAAQTDIDPILLFDGADHQEWNDEDYAGLAAHFGNDDTEFEFIHSSPDAYMDEMLAQVDRIEDRLVGELLAPAKYAFDIDQQGYPQGVWSSRVWLKQENAFNQARLCHWVEPFAAFAAGAVCVPVDADYLTYAWKTLIKNHAHDSIGGCSIDDVHADMITRNRQVRQLADRLTDESLLQLAASVGDPVADEVRVVVYNPHPVPVSDVVDLRIPLPVNWAIEDPTQENPPRPDLNLQQDGMNVDYQLTGWYFNKQNVRFYPAKAPQKYFTNDAVVSVPVTLPALGYTTLSCHNAARARRQQPLGPNLAIDDHTLENAFLRVVVEQNGRLTLTDKRNQQIYRDLLAFEDVADVGDGYDFKPAPFDQAINNAAVSAEIALIAHGPFKASLRIRQTLSIPEEYDAKHGHRAERRLPMTIDSTVTLRRDATRVEVETRIDNPAKDHRLRVLFSSGATTDTYLAETPFDVVERTIAQPPDADQWRELPLETKPQQSWTAAHDEQRGLAIVTAGLLETAVRDLPQRPIALTLFRATRHLGNLMATPELNNGQALREMTFNYWIVPLQGAPNRTQLCYDGQQILTVFRSVVLQSADGKLHRQPVQLPAQAGFLQVSGNAVVTSVRDVDGALEVRLFNPETSTQEIVLDWGERPDSMQPIILVQRVNLESMPLSEPEVISGVQTSVVVNPKQIITLRLMTQ